MGVQRSLTCIERTWLAQVAEDNWRGQAKKHLFLANAEEDCEGRTESVLNFAAYEVLSRLAHTLRKNSEGWEWPEHVDIRVVQDAVREVIGKIALYLLVNIDVDAIINRADEILYKEVHFLRRDHRRTTDEAGVHSPMNPPA